VNGEEGSSASSSSSEDESQRAFNRRHQTRHYSFAEHQGESSADEGTVEKDAPVTSSSVPAEQERQLLLLMLLAQVCALHDPTPRTFTVHVLELFERGILDRQSILFLFELGLVPSTTTSKLILPKQNCDDENNNNRTAAERLRLVNLNPQQAAVRQRTAEASAIRSSLEQQERQYRKSQSEPMPQRDASWSAKHHPLSLSRYQREFEQVCLLSSGAFGQVFQARNYMDGNDYAIKRIQFSATGYSQESVQQVVRECHCLAACNHPNVVRYYTSWLEPSWMTGSGASSVVDTDQHQQLLKDITHIVAGSSKGDDESQSVSNKLQSYFTEHVSPRRPRRRYSFDASESGWDLEQSEVSVDHVQSSFSKDDLFADDIFDRSSEEDVKALDIQRNQSSHARYQRPRRKQQKQKYSYQICLFIQMQLCHPSTLADWIRERNKSGLYPTVSKRIETVQEIFHQCVCGLAHCHENHIIHRDLKPANIFATVEGELQFKIGDFGLSKMIRKAMRPNRGRSRPGPLLLSSSEDWQDKRPSPCLRDETAKDPLTAGVGTASYASPEQVTSKTYDVRADIFSLGLILLELACGFGTNTNGIKYFRTVVRNASCPVMSPNSKHWHTRFWPVLSLLRVIVHPRLIC